MTDLFDAANRAERAASRRLAERTGMSGEQALLQTLEQSAGAGGLPALLARRLALREDEAMRATERRARKEAALALRRARHDGAPTAWRAWFDGSAHPNPGRCGIGGILKGPAGELVEISSPAGYGNSSEAEYRALIALLQAAVDHGAHGLTIYGDSQVVVNDVNGPELDAAVSLRGCRDAAHVLIAQLRGVTLRWIPRHKNTEADALSQRASALPQDYPTDDLIT